MTPIPLDCLLDQGLYGWRKYLLQRLPQDLAPQLGGFWAWDGCLNGGRWARGSSLASSQGPLPRDCSFWVEGHKQGDCIQLVLFGASRAQGRSMGPECQLWWGCLCATPPFWNLSHSFAEVADAQLGTSCQPPPPASYSWHRSLRVYVRKCHLIWGD